MKRLTLAIVLWSAGLAQAQGLDAASYRARVANEVIAETQGGAWTKRNLFVATGESSASWNDRVKFGAAVGIRAAATDVTLRTREAYSRWSALPWLDVEAGRRIMRWGTGYAFTPTGVLDPRRDPVDPQDRLGMHEGVVMVKADAYAGPASMTLVASRRLQAARVRTTLRGVEVAMIAAVDKGQAPSWGANFTHVIGERLEWHGEVLSHESDATRDRTTSALIGLQYTLAAGPNIVVEYYRSPTRGGSAVFARVSRGPGDWVWSPDAILVVNPKTRDVSFVPSIGFAFGEHTVAYIRGAVNRSRLGVSGGTTTGLSLRF